MSEALPRLRHPGPPWSADDYDVVCEEELIGRIFRPRLNVPEDRPWMWTMAGAVLSEFVCSHGFEATRDEARAAIAEHWRKWIAKRSD